MGTGAGHWPGCGGRRSPPEAEEGPDLILWGSSTLTSALLEYGIADELVLFTYPVLLGKGKRLFAEGTPARTLELTSMQAFRPAWC